MRSELAVALHQALAEHLRTSYGVKDIEKVTGFEEYQYSSGYCDTCYHEETRIRITYVTSDGTTQTEDVYGSFTELIRTLTDE